ncbi:MAG: hypothetical protein ACFFDN_42860 [Candidatus Hodarchaeota archaeon]
MGKDIKGAIVIEGHVQGLAITRSLGEEGIPVIVIDKNNCIARYSKYCKIYYRCPDFLDERLIPFLVNLAKENNLYAWILFPTNDHAVYNISKYKEHLEKYYNIITPKFENLIKIYDKKKLLTISVSNGVNIPKSYFPDSLALEEFDLNFPVLIKGAEGLTFFKKLGRKAYKVDSLAELRMRLGEILKVISLEKIIIQELISYNQNNNVLSFTAFCIDGYIKCYWIGEKIREHPPRFGTATFCKSVNNNRLLEISKPLLRSIGYTGVCEIEYLLDPRFNEYKILEMNARTWLWISLARLCGVNYPIIVYRYLLNVEQQYPKNYEIGVKWIHLTTDIFFFLKRKLSRVEKLQELRLDYNGKKEFAVFSFKDIKPFIFEMISLPYLALKRQGFQFLN